MTAPNLYEVAKQQIEKEFQAETRDARQRRQAKLDSLEALRSTLENATPGAFAENGSQDVVSVDEPTPNSSEPKSLSQRIKDEILAFGNTEQIKMPEVHARLKVRYPDVEQLNDGNVRSLIATLLKQMTDRRQIHMVSRGSGNEPHIYSNAPMLALMDNVFVQPNTNGGSDFSLYDAVRNAIKGFNGKGFSYRDILGVLRKQHPEHITKAREASVSATLSNLTKRGELIKTALFDGKNSYRAVEQ